MKEKVYIIGAGLAGLSAAYHLVKAGHKDIEIFESSPYAGGRCRSFYDEKLGAEIDNGNHLIMGANTNVLSLIEELGVEDKFNKFDDRIFTFFNNRKGERYYFKAPLPDIETYGITGLLIFLKFVLIPTTKPVKQAFKLTHRLFDEIINPISRSILNTPSEVANSNILRKVFLKIITSKNGFDYYYPKASWEDALIKPLTEHLEKNGVKINYGKALKKVHSSQFTVHSLVFDEEIDVNNAKVILAVPPQVACKLVDITTPDEFYPIINIHFKLVHELQPQIFGVIESNIEWVFVKPGLISTTFSAAAERLNESEMVKEAWTVCYKVLGLKSDMPPYKVITEKRATFAATTEQLKKRPDTKTKYNNLFLAGDYTNTGLPATIEGAVTSGKKVCNIIE